MTTLFDNQDAQRTRVDISEDDLAKYVQPQDMTRIPQIIELLDGGGLGMLKARVIERFAGEITKGGNDVTAESQGQIILTDGVEDPNWRKKIDTATAASIATGMHTLSSIMGFKQICFKRATLFDVESKYLYSDGEFGPDLQIARAKSSHDRRMGRIDLLATGIGSDGGWVQITPRGYLYQSFDPSRAYVVFADEITYGDKLATPDKNNIEDASVVVICLDERFVNEDGTAEKWYIAMFGKSENYPNGRMVKYHTNSWHDIPKPGNGGVDYTIGAEFSETATIEEIANPLTLYSIKTKGKSGVEYPVFDWRMDRTGDGTGVFPVSGTLAFDLLFDLDVEISRGIESAGRSARGAWFVDDPRSQGFSSGSPSEGDHLLGKDQEPTLLSHSASNAAQAHATILDQYEQIASSFNVPAHHVTTRKAIQANSGYALDVMNMPLTNDRRMRHRQNAEEMQRKFAMERALLNYMSDTEKIPLGAVEKWIPGKMHKPENLEEVRAQSDWELTNGFDSIVDLMVEIKALESREQAIEFLERNKEENAKYITQQPTAPQQGGALIRRTQR